MENSEYSIAKTLPVLLLLLAFYGIACADEINAKVIHVYKDESVGGKYSSKELIAGVNMGEPSDGCTQMIGKIKVEGVQFSSSGATLESFRFTDKNGTQWSVPTEFGKLSNVARGEANNFIRVGKTYFSHIELCGSGGFAGLINLYDMNISFGTK